jgi:hypothetical protein
MLNNKLCKLHLLIFTITLYTVKLCAQNAGKIIEQTQAYHTNFPSEKLYLHFDRPYYTTYDTIWFKASLFNPATYTPSRLSSKVYIELINDSSIVVNRFAIPLEAGLGEGYIALDEKISDGTYTIRAYTNWMQNFGEDVFFSRQFYVGKSSVQGAWLIKEQHTLKSLATVNEINLALNLTNVNKSVIPYKDIELRLAERKKLLFKRTFTTNDAGNVTVNFSLPSKADVRKLSLLITDKNTNNRYILPFYPGSTMQNIDVQFMPESGELVNGLACRVGFKAIGEDGLGINIKGVVLNQAGKEVSSFKTSHAGMGSFLLLPRSDETYTAKFDINGVSHSAPLPLVKPTGLNLRVDNLSSADSVHAYVSITPDIAQANQLYTLIVHSAGGVYMGFSFTMREGFLHIPFAKKDFISGIVSFTLLNNHSKPLLERKIFIDQHDRLNLKIANSKLHYKPIDSVALNLEVNDALGHPVVGNFSVSVTDDAYIKNDSLSDNIISRLLLTSELKGYIEKPNWYFISNDIDTKTALDNLMLTQGWTGFNWDKALTPAVKPLFKPEPNNRLTGNLRSLFKKPVKNAKLNFFSVSKKYGVIVLDTVSDDRGEFAFENLPIYDTISYTLRVNNKNDKASAATVNLDLFEPAKVSDNQIRVIPWYAHVNDSSMLAYFNRQQPPRYNGIDISQIKGKLLKEVKVKASAQSITAERYSGFVTKEIFEKELIDAGKTTLYDLVCRKINNFGIGYLFKDSMFSRVAMHDYPALVIGINMVSDLIVDGQGTTLFSENATPPANFPNPKAAIDFMKMIGADDVKNIKIAEGLQIFIVVTTRSGKGHFTRPAYNVLAYRPVPYCLPRQFYRPRYDVKNTVAFTPRPTIHWEPNLITDKNGKGGLSFFAADKPGTYTVIIEGTDMNGNFGRQTSKIIIHPDN